VAESHLLAGHHSDRGTDRRLEHLDPDSVSCDRTRCREDLAHHARLAKCHNLEQPSGFLRQLRDAEGESALETIRQRQRRSADRSNIAGTDRQLDQREGVSAGLVQQPVTHRRDESWRGRIQELFCRSRSKANEPVFR
jgi:hypothetical protein